MKNWLRTSFVVFALISSSSFFPKVFSKVTINNGCAQTTLGNSSKMIPSKVPQMSWIHIPSLVEMEAGKYRILGRVVHLKYVKEQLEKKQGLNYDFCRARQEMRLIPKVEIQTDSLYVEGSVKLYGIKELTVCARRIIATPGSELDISAPNWNQQFTNRVTTGADGEKGNDGIDGPKIEMLVGVVRGSLTVIANGGNGHKGQDGGSGENAEGLGKPQPDRPKSLCSQGMGRCSQSNFPGTPGKKGKSGKKGGNAGTPGNGGRAGNIVFSSGKVKGNVLLKSCKGIGAEPAKNGQGGRGGEGSRGGKGRYCGKIILGKYLSICGSVGLGPKAPDGARGDNGPPGRTPNIKGKDGAVSLSNIRSSTLDTQNKQRFPLELLKIMKRKAEDLLLAKPKSRSGKNALKFIMDVVKERTDVNVSFKREVKRKYGFAGKEDFDMFGRNKLFAPRIKWEALKVRAENVKNSAKEYEVAFNGIKASIENKGDIAQLAKKMSSLAEKQIESEKKRLVEAKNIAESEKRLYVKSIRQLEGQMNGILKQVETMLPEVYEKAKMNANDFLAILQGLTGFVSSIASKDPFAFIDSALGIAESQLGKQCLNSLEGYLASIKKWLTFGKNYNPLKDSSDLDFDQVDVNSVPEIMQANLEMQKESLASELVCLLDVASRESDVAPLKQQLESYFIAGAARIDLIGKITDLDNEIGGYNFDIPLLEETATTIKDLGNPSGTPITKDLQLRFMENLLSTYREMERTFMESVYELYKAFKFRTLWEGENPLAEFQRVASESARGTGRLNGMIQLTEVLQNMEKLEITAVKCFTDNIYADDVKKWSFDKNKHQEIFKGIAKGYTRFNINIDKSCTTCYNIRLLKLYVELTGDEKQEKNIPKDVHLQIRHLSASYFRAGDNSIKDYRQPLGSYRKIEFNRFATTDQRKCEESTAPSTFCLTKVDSRWEPMCSHPLSKSTCRDSLLGQEECKSPFGTYELKIPVDKNLACDNNGITDKNCKDLDLTKFTKMNVWMYYIYWSDNYPTGPKDPICRSPRDKRKHVTLPDFLQPLYNNGTL